MIRKLPGKIIFLLTVKKRLHSSWTDVTFIQGLYFPHLWAFLYFFGIEKILCHNICTYWFNFEFLIFNVNFILWTFSYIFNQGKKLHIWMASWTDGTFIQVIIFSPMVFPSMSHLMPFCTYWFNFEFLFLIFFYELSYISDPDLLWPSFLFKSFIFRSSFGL